MWTLSNNVKITVSHFVGCFFFFFSWRSGGQEEGNILLFFLKKKKKAAAEDHRMQVYVSRFILCSISLRIVMGLMYLSNNVIVN